MDKKDKMIYMNIFNKIIDLFKITSSLILLEYATNMALKYDGCKNLLEKSLEWKLKHVNNDEQIKIIKWIQNQCLTDTSNFTPLLNYFITIIDFARETTLKTYFEQNIQAIYYELEESVSEYSFVNLYRKVIALISIKYFFILNEDARVSIIKNSLLELSETDFSKSVTKLCFLISSIKIEQFENVELQKLGRLYICMSYNTLAAVIQNTETNNLALYEPLFKFYGIWSKLIDCSVNYTFPQDFEEIPSRKNKVRLLL